jgi:pyruvate dehydrogenase E1 component beta subunit
MAQITYRQALHDTLREELLRDENVFLMGEEIGNEEDWLSLGVGAEIAARIQEEAFDYLDAPVKRVASVKVPLPYSKPLERAALTGAKQLTEAIQELTLRRRQS